MKYLYFYAVCLEYTDGEYYYRYEKEKFPCEERMGGYHISKYPGCPFYLDSFYTEAGLDRIHGKKNHWYAYVVFDHENEEFAKMLLAEELERRHTQALGIVNATSVMIEELGKNSKEKEER